MSKSVSIDQSHSVIQALANNVDWSVLDGNVLQEKIIKNQKEAGKQFTAFLKNGGKVIIDSPRIINIDRSVPFDPESFSIDFDSKAIYVGHGMSIGEQDERALSITEIDLTKVMFDSALRVGEKVISGEKSIKRFKGKNIIRLDAGIFKTLWKDPNLIPEKWKEKTNGDNTYVFFDGTIFLDSSGTNGGRYVMYLSWAYNTCSWSFGYSLLIEDRRDNCKSAFLMKNTSIY